MKGFLNIENICNVIHFDKSLFIIQMLTQMQAKVFANWNFYHEMGSQSYGNCTNWVDIPY